MAEGYEVSISDEEKARIASDLIKQGPPGEFNEVLNDVRVLLQNDSILKGPAGESFAKYNMEQFIPVKCEGSDEMVLLTKHGLLEDGRFLDPFHGRSFKVDHLRKETSDFRDHSMNTRSESFRKASQEAARGYVKAYYPHGVFTVYGSSTDADVLITVCIEDHQYQSKNYWNGRWRSEWTMKISDGSDKAEISGCMKVQVHYYDDGNVQLVTSKEHEDSISVTTEKSTAEKLIKLMGNVEAAYQTAISESYNTMSDTTFKALRRKLPITRNTIAWDKILSYKIGKELKNA